MAQRTRFITGVNRTAIASRCWARRLDRIRALADELGDGAVAIEADVSDRDSIVAAFQRVQDDVGGADILVNNAGVMLLGPFSAELSTDYRRMIETNLLGAITTTRCSSIGSSPTAEVI